MSQTPLIEKALRLIGFGGIGLSLLFSLYVMTSVFFFPGGGMIPITGFILTCLGIAAGFLFIALSEILSHLRRIADSLERPNS